MKKYIQTPESIKNLFLTFYQNSIPGLTELTTEPMLVNLSQEEAAWLWIVSDKMYLTYFGGVFKIFDKLPPALSRPLIRKEGNCNKFNIPISFQWEIYPAEYFSNAKKAPVQNFVLELTAGNWTDQCLIDLYRNGVIFDIFAGNEISEISLARQDKIAEKLLKSSNKKIVEVAISYKENKFWAESDICPEGALAEASLKNLLKQVPKAVGSFVSDFQLVYKYTLPALLYSIKNEIPFSAIAEYVGVDQRCIYDYAYGKRYPKADKLEKIMAFIRQSGQKLLNIELKEK